MGQARDLERKEGPTMTPDTQAKTQNGIDPWVYATYTMRTVIRRHSPRLFVVACVMTTWVNTTWDRAKWEAGYHASLQYPRTRGWVSDPMSLKKAEALADQWNREGLV